MNVNVEELFIRCEIPDWESRKANILEEIKFVGNMIGIRVDDNSHFSGNTAVSKISETTFFTIREFGYGENINRTVEDFFLTMRKNGIVSNFPGGMWHQVYERGDTHDWHVHPMCNMSTVFYVNLPDENSSTEFSFGSETYKPTVKEGEFLSFPASLAHRSPIHDNDEAKIIMSFNWDLKHTPFPEDIGKIE